MSLRFNLSERHPRAGFTLLEALVAFAILVSAAVSVYALAIGSLRSQVENSNDLELAAFARAVLEEYVVTYPLVPKQGTYDSVWDWDISETKIPHVAPSEYDQYFEYVQVEIRVGRSLQTDSFDLVTVVARRAPGT